MKNILSIGAAVGVSLLALTGCGDDEPTGPDINPFYEPKQGDTLTYARYDRDMNNQRDESSKSIHKWVVLQTGLSYQGKTSVAKILQLNYDATGTALQNSDTVYLRSAADGEIFMNVVPAILNQIDVARPFADSIQFKWFKVGDTKTSNAVTWFSFGTATGFTQDVQYPFGGLGTVTVRMVIDADASHKGKMPVTIGTTSYPNSFHTDHWMQLTGTIPGLGGAQVLKDSVQLGFDVDITNGILRQTMNSDSVTATVPGSPAATEAVPGFEMELIATTRK